MSARPATMPASVGLPSVTKPWKAASSSSNGFFAEVRREKAMDRLVEWSTSLDGLDREVLLHAEEGWGWNR